MTRGPAEQKLLQALEAYFAAAKRGKDAGVDLQAHFKSLDQLAAGLPAGADPRLRHYLQQKSYRKAHAVLLGSDPEAGTCR